MQKITLIGNLGNDPIESVTPNDHKVTSFSLAVKVNKESVVWYKINIWKDRIHMFKGMLATLKKGSKICVLGDLGAPFPYINKQGNAAVKLTVHPFSMGYIGSLTDKKKDDDSKQSGVQTCNTDIADIPF